MCTFKVLEANRVSLWHTSFFGVLKGAEPKSAVCPVQKWPIRPQNGEIQNGHYLKCIYVHILFTKQGRNLNEMCFCRFSWAICGIQCRIQFWDKMWRNCLKLIFNAKKSDEFIAKIKWKKTQKVCTSYVVISVLSFSRVCWQQYNIGSLRGFTKCAIRSNLWNTPRSKAEVQTGLRMSIHICYRKSFIACVRQLRTHELIPGRHECSGRCCQVSCSCTPQRISCELSCSCNVGWGTSSYNQMRWSSCKHSGWVAERVAVVLTDRPNASIPFRSPEEDQDTASVLGSRQLPDSVHRARMMRNLAASEVGGRVSCARPILYSYFVACIDLGHATHLADEFLCWYN